MSDNLVSLATPAKTIYIRMFYCVLAYKGGFRHFVVNGRMHEISVW